MGGAEQKPPRASAWGTALGLLLVAGTAAALQSAARDFDHPARLVELERIAARVGQ